MRMHAWSFTWNRVCWNQLSTFWKVEVQILFKGLCFFVIIRKKNLKAHKGLQSSAYQCLKTFQFPSFHFEWIEALWKRFYGKTRKLCENRKHDCIFMRIQASFELITTCAGTIPTKFWPEPETCTLLPLLRRSLSLT